MVLELILDWLVLWENEIYVVVVFGEYFWLGVGGDDVFVIVVVDVVYDGFVVIVFSEVVGEDVVVD